MLHFDYLIVVIGNYGSNVLKKIGRFTSGIFKYLQKKLLQEISLCDLGYPLLLLEGYTFK